MPALHQRRFDRVLVWPLPALLGWALAWAVFGSLRWVDAPIVIALGAAAVAGGACSLVVRTAWRRGIIAGGFPLSLAISGLAAGLPAWAWLLPLLLLGLIYPINAWRDAPLFPTPAGALRGLAALAPLGPEARVLDAGCGLGDGLHELHLAYPHARIDGIEWSWLLRLACACRCRFAHVKRADMWTADWSGYDLVYLFQRPESMPRAAAKAALEQQPGAWLASLEFAVPALEPTAVLNCADGRRVWLYRQPFNPVRR